MHWPERERITSVLRRLKDAVARGVGEGLVGGKMDIWERREVTLTV